MEEKSTQHNENATLLNTGVHWGVQSTMFIPALSKNLRWRGYVQDYERHEDFDVPLGLIIITNTSEGDVKKALQIEGDTAKFHFPMQDRLGSIMKISDSIISEHSPDISEFSFKPFEDKAQLLNWCLNEMVPNPDS